MAWSGMRRGNPRWSHSDAGPVIGRTGELVGETPEGAPAHSAARLGALAAELYAR
jgi:hypothetical protein